MSRFERLYRDNFPFVWAAARRLGAPDDAVSDVVQDVFVTAHRRLDELRYEVSPRGWLYGVTRRVASRYRRSAARTARRKAAVAVRAVDREHPHARHEAARELDGLLEQVDEDQRNAFVMSELLGMTGPEIAGELRIPLPTVYSRLRLARSRLAHVATAQRLDESLQAARTEQAPARGQAQRSWAALLPVVGSPWPAVKATVAAATTSIWTPLAIVGAVAIGIAQRPSETLHAGAEHPGAGPATATSASDDPERGTSASAKSLEDAPAPASSTLPPASIPADPAAPAPVPTHTATSPGEPPARARMADDLTHEVERLEAARQALRRGDPGAALSELDALDVSIAAGQLLDARGAARVRALCDLGRHDEAAREADRLRREHPRSTLVREISAQCDAS